MNLFRRIQTFKQLRHGAHRDADLTSEIIKRFPEQATDVVAALSTVQRALYAIGQTTQRDLHQHTAFFTENPGTAAFQALEDQYGEKPLPAQFTFQFYTDEGDETRQNILRNAEHFNTTPKQHVETRLIHPPNVTYQAFAGLTTQKPYQPSKHGVYAMAKPSIHGETQ